MPVGVFVAIMGLVAAIMAFQKEPKRSEKALWILCLTALLVAEIRNLYTADRQQANTFNQISQSLDASKKGLDATADGIRNTTDQAQKQFEVTIDRVNKTLEASEAAQRNTQPFADIELDTVNPRTLVVHLNPNEQVEFNVFYKNVGSDTAEQVVLDGKDYVGPLGNEAFEKTIGRDFDKWWRTVKHQAGGSIVPGQPKPFFTFKSHTFAVPEVQSILSRTSTIYILTRWTYRDKTGGWIGDNCIAYQDPTHDLAVAHPCIVHNNHRYRQP
ncbi:MAG: hypothetical protein WBA09_15490 [Candidatus Acidiferrum sp.]